MAQSCYYLDGYPLYEHYHACWEFLDHDVDWSFHGKDATWFDISHVMRLFPHLTLDENYRLVCYLTSGYHGTFGQVRALRHGVPSEPTVESIFSDPRVDSFLGKKLTPPKESAAPMEAIYHDGTAYGCFEALLCSEFLSALPGTNSVYQHWMPFLTAPPPDYPSAWDTYLDVTDWRPRILMSKSRTPILLAYARYIENGTEGSDGRDLIHLTQYSFERNLWHYHYKQLRMNLARPEEQIEDNSRYKDGRWCYVFNESTIVIAQEREGWCKFKNIRPMFEAPQAGVENNR